MIHYYRWGILTRNPPNLFIFSPSPAMFDYLAKISISCNCTIILGTSYCKVLSLTMDSLNSDVKIYRNVYLGIKNIWLYACMCLFTYMYVRVYRKFGNSYSRCLKDKPRLFSCDDHIPTVQMVISVNHGDSWISYLPFPVWPE